MAYTINLTDGTIFAVIADGTINTDSSMTLVGKNYAGYGEFLDENFIHLLENSANPNAPGDPLTGQLWWDATNDVLKVYTGVNFKVISTALASANAPTQSLVTGDLWYDTVNAQLKVFTGSGFILVGPAFTAGTGTSGAIVDTVTDSSPGADHVVVKVFCNNTIVSIFSKDATFTPAAALSGFATIGPGLNMSTTVAGAVFNGTTTNADLLDNLNSTQFMRSDTNTSTSGTLSVLNDTGLYVGGDSDGRLSVQGIDVYLRNQTLDGDIYFQVNDGGATTSPIVIEGATSNVTIQNGLSVNGTISSSGGPVNFGTAAVSLGSIVNNNANGVGNIGTSSSSFNTIFAKATSAQYADLAERFEADAVYAPGTVVMLGGEKEITAAMEEATDDVFGVISTRPAYTMNDAAGNDVTHPPITMTGRVPVLVVGQVRKGDRLISAGNGLARAARQGETTAFNVIGRSLTSKISNDKGTVEAIVTIK
jgi:hypothetical protein